MRKLISILVLTAIFVTSAAVPMVAQDAPDSGGGAPHIYLPMVFSGESAATQATLSSAGTSSAPRPESCDPLIRFNRARFSNPTAINNKYLPLIPGTQLFLEGTTISGSHRVIFTVSDVTKVINGVRTLVVWDRDISDGELAERELAFFAQDDDGNVWNLGEYPEVFESGQFVGAPSTWIAGLADAKAGIHMLKKPKENTASYLQGLAPDVEFFDCARVFATGQTVSVPNAYDNVLVTEEWSPPDPAGGSQLKYHAPNVGIVKIAFIDDNSDAEILDLVKLKQLGPDAMNKVRERVCKLDKRGHRFSDVYHDTAIAERNGRPCIAAEASEDEAKRNITGDAAEWYK